MRKKVLICIALSMVLECTVSTGLPAALREKALDENETCGCLIVGLLGNSYVKPARSPRYIPLKLNMAVFGGTFLQVSASSKAMLACGSAFKELTSGVYPVPCNSGEGVPIPVGKKIVDPARIRGGDFPRLLSPRTGALLNAHPTFRWTPVPNAAQYSIVVRGGNVDWSAIVKSAEIVYPNNAPPLVAGPAYKVTIFAARRGSSDDEGAPGLEFRLLSAQDAEKVKSRETEIKNLNLEAASKQLLIAYLYATYNLFAEAITLLKDTAADQESARALAELYIRSSLLDRAEEQYSKVVEMAGEDLPARAAAYDRLGQINEALNKKDQAMQKYQNALKLYVDLEDWNKVSEFAIQLSKLQKP